MMIKKRITILFTSIGGGLAPLVIKLLKNSDFFEYNVVGVDANASCESAYFCDSFYQVPYGDTIEYIHKMLTISKSNNVDVILPGSDEEALNLSANKGKFSLIGTEIAVADNEILSLIANKINFYKKLEENEIFVPTWHVVTNKQEINSILESYERKNLPCVIKPSRGRGSRGVYLIYPNENPIDRNDLSGREKRLNYREFYSTRTEYDDDKRLYPSIVMDLIPGAIYDIDILSSAGKPIHILPRKRIDPSFPNSGHILFREQKFIELAEKLISIFKLDCLMDIDVMIDNNGRLCILEVNPRQSGSVSVGITAGVPLIDDLIKSIFGLKIDKISEYPNSLKVIPYKALEIFDA